MGSKYLLSVVIAISLSAFCNGYEDCGSEVGKITDVVIPGCNVAKTCILKRNTNVTLEISFTAEEDSNTLEAVVHGVILGVPLPFSLPNPDGCKDSGIVCPIKAGQTYKYVSQLPVLSAYPRVSVDVNWKLKAADDKSVVCALIPAKIK